MFQTLVHTHGGTLNVSCFDLIEGRQEMSHVCTVIRLSLFEKRIFQIITEYATLNLCIFSKISMNAVFLLYYLDNEFGLMQLEYFPFYFYMTTFVWHVCRQREAIIHVARILKSKIKQYNTAKLTNTS